MYCFYTVPLGEGKHILGFQWLEHKLWKGTTSGATWEGNIATALGMRKKAEMTSWCVGDSFT